MRLERRKHREITPAWDTDRPEGGRVPMRRLVPVFSSLLILCINLSCSRSLETEGPKDESRWCRRMSRIPLKRAALQNL